MYLEPENKETSVIWQLLLNRPIATRDDGQKSSEEFKWDLQKETKDERMDYHYQLEKTINMCGRKELEEYMRT